MQSNIYTTHCNISPYNLYVPLEQQLKGPLNLIYLLSGLCSILVCCFHCTVFSLFLTSLAVGTKLTISMQTDHKEFRNFVHASDPN